MFTMLCPIVYGFVVEAHRSPPWQIGSRTVGTLQIIMSGFPPEIPGARAAVTSKYCTPLLPLAHGHLPGLYVPLFAT